MEPLLAESPWLLGINCCDKEKDNIWTSGDSGSLGVISVESMEPEEVIAHPSIPWDVWLLCMCEDKENLSWLERSSSWEAVDVKLGIPCMGCMGREPWGSA